jgi:hypothetical protein
VHEGLLDELEDRGNLSSRPGRDRKTVGPVFEGVRIVRPDRERSDRVGTDAEWPTHPIVLHRFCRPLYYFCIPSREMPKVAWISSETQTLHYPF